MKCGACKTEGVTVSHVRDCYSRKYSAPGTGARAQTPAVKVVPNLVALNTAGADIGGVYIGCDPETSTVSYYRVQANQRGVNFYAKRWNGEWIYEGRKPLHFLTLEDKVTAEQAAQFGKAWGSCVFCSRLLTDERSIEVGYGPVCAEKQALPWG